MPKSISASVGKGGTNRVNDVVTIQYLLNCVPAYVGGPEQELVVDGLVGPLTIGAISHLQTTQLGFCDGRVDPGGKTFQKIVPFDPNPTGPPVEPGAIGTKEVGKDYPSKGKSNGKTGTKTGTKTGSNYYPTKSPDGGKTFVESDGSTTTYYPMPPGYKRPPGKLG